MAKENEIRYLEIDKFEMIKKLIEMGATLKSGEPVSLDDVSEDKEFPYEKTQIRYVYDMNPKDPNRWMRLRTNGTEATLTIKEICEDTVDGTLEWEIGVSDFETTHQMLEKCGFKAKAKQENKRITFNLDGVEIDVDTWPGIPTYMEIEGKTVDDVYSTLDKLGIDRRDENLTAKGVQDVYLDIYGIDIRPIKQLTFEYFQNCQRGM